MALSQAEATTPRALALIEGMAREGANINEIAKALNCHYGTFGKWIKENPLIGEAYNKGKMIPDYQVENALLKAALGYTTKREEITTVIRGGEVVETVKKVTTEERAPNVSAITAWLYNRKPDKWKNPNSKNIFDDVDKESGIEIKITRPAKNPNENWDDVNESVTVSKQSEQKPKKKVGRPKKNKEEN